MLDFLRGQKESIRRLCGGLELELEFYHKAPLEIDVGCFGLDDAGKLSDEVDRNLSNEHFFVFCAGDRGDSVE